MDHIFFRFVHAITIESISLPGTWSRNELSPEYMTIGQLFLRVKDPEGQIPSRTLKPRNELSQVQLTLG
jgi:hypothetical protein